MSLQFISLLIGGVLGEQIAGYGSDVLVNWRTKRAGGRRIPEFRLALATPGFLLSIVGVIGQHHCSFSLLPFTTERFFNQSGVYNCRMVL